MARQQKPDRERKSVVLGTRMTPDQAAKLRNLATSRKRSVSEIVRVIALDLPLPPEPLHWIDREALLELRRVGTNLNQIARMVNSGKLVLSPEELALLQEVQVQNFDLMRQLRDAKPRRAPKAEKPTTVPA